MKDKLCLDTQDYEKKRAIFTEKQRLLKAPKHPELREDEFVNGRLKRAVEAPTFVYQDFEKPQKRRAQYLREYKINNEVRYTKVTVEIKEHFLFVVTAYRPNYVKERGRTKLLYGKDDDQ